MEATASNQPSFIDYARPSSSSSNTSDAQELSVKPVDVSNNVIPESNAAATHRSASSSEMLDQKSVEINDPQITYMKHRYEDKDREQHKNELTGLSALNPQGLDRLAEKNKNKIALATACPEEGCQTKWDTKWCDLSARTQQAARALISLNLEPGETITIWSENRPEWEIVNIAAKQARLVNAPVSSKVRLETAQYCIELAGTSVLFVRGPDQVKYACETLLPTMDNLQTVVVFDDSIDTSGRTDILTFDEFMNKGSEDHQHALNQRIDSQQDCDLVDLVFTSGTTGQPKAVQLTRRNVNASFANQIDVVDISDSDILLSALPKDHIFQNAVDGYCLTKGASVHYLTAPAKPDRLPEALRTVKPTICPVVPVIPDRIMNKIHDKTERSNFIKQKYVKSALAHGYKSAEHERTGHRPGLVSRIKSVFYKPVYNKLESRLGGNLQVLPCGGAKLDAKTQLFFDAMGVKIIQGYGMSETTATVTAAYDGKCTPGSVGVLMKNVQCRLYRDNSDEELKDLDEGMGAIQLQGPTMTSGYFKDPEKTQELISTDGWLKTGDYGYFNEQKDELFIEGRLGERQKLANGEYLPVEKIEHSMNKDPWIQQIVITANDRPCVGALIVPDFENIKKSGQFGGGDNQTLSQNQELKEQLQIRMNKISNDIGTRKIEKFVLLSEPLTQENGAMTATLKFKRKYINQTYASAIESMYKTPSMPKSSDTSGAKKAI